MKIYVNGVDDLDIESQVTDYELMVIVNAHMRGLIREAKVAVVFQGGRRYLEVAAIDAARTLPGVVFDAEMPPKLPGIASTRPPPMPSLRSFTGHRTRWPAFRATIRRKRRISRRAFLFFCRVVCYPRGGRRGLPAGPRSVRAANRTAPAERPEVAQVSAFGPCADRSNRRGCGYGHLAGLCSSANQNDLFSFPQALPHLWYNTPKEERKRLRQPWPQGRAAVRTHGNAHRGAATDWAWDGAPIPRILAAYAEQVHARQAARGEAGREGAAELQPVPGEAERKRAPRYGGVPPRGVREGQAPQALIFLPSRKAASPAAFSYLFEFVADGPQNWLPFQSRPLERLTPGGGPGGPQNPSASGGTHGFLNCGTSALMAAFGESFFFVPGRKFISATR